MSGIVELSEPPYGAIRDELVAGRVIPFLGAGASLAERVPPTAPWKDPDPSRSVHYVPTAGDLACYLAHKWAFPLTNEETAGRDLPRIAQYCSIRGGRTPLRRTLHKTFDWDAPIRPIHEFLASIEKPLLIVTTNYDDILERALRSAGRKFDVVVHTTDSNTGDNLFWTPHEKPREEKLASDFPQTALERTIIFKMHGTVDRSAGPNAAEDDTDRGDFVITEDDYIYFLTQLIRNQAIPAVFIKPLQDRHFLFLGYSLTDWNMRVVLNQIEESRRVDQEWRKNRGIKSWAIQRDVDPIEKIFWDSRGVDLYRMEIDKFVEKLR